MKGSVLCVGYFKQLVPKPVQRAIGVEMHWCGDELWLGVNSCVKSDIHPSIHWSAQAVQ